MSEELRKKEEMAAMEELKKKEEEARKRANERRELMEEWVSSLAVTKLRPNPK